MSFKTVLPGAWELTKNEEYELFSLHVPTAWQQVAKSLAQQRFNLQGKGYPSVPVYSLDPIIAASFPNIIKTERNGWQHPNFPWLLATETAELLDLPMFIKDWLREEFSTSLVDDSVESALSRLDDNAWKWEDKPTIYPLSIPTKNQYGIDIRFQAIPDFLAVEFLKNPQVTFGVNNQYKLTFYRVVKLKQGAELMSWPPCQIPLIQNKKLVGQGYISFVIRFTLQTVSWRHEPIIYHQLSIRRWVTQPLTKLPYRGVTAFIGDNRRWLDGNNQLFCLIPLEMKASGKEAKWHKAISKLLEINGSLLPDHNILANQPLYNMSDIGEEPNGIQAAIAYDSRHSIDLLCLPGVSPLDLASLDSAIQNKIAQGNFPIRRVGEAVKISGKNMPFWEPGKPQKKDSKETKNPNDLSTPMLRPQIATPATFSSRNNHPNTILILWHTEKCRDALISQICELLLLSPKGETKEYETQTGITGEETIYEGSEGRILSIKTQHVGEMTQQFDFNNPSVEGHTRKQKRIFLMEQRISQIVLSLPKPKGLSGALIEIQPKPFIPESDPKLALRIGAMQAGYLNQHIHALTKTKKDNSEYVTRDATNRVQKAVSDLLRQFGILPAPLIDSYKDGINEKTWLTCFYVLRRTRKTTASNTPSTVVLMVRVNPVTGIVQMTTPSLFEKQGWSSYPEALSHLLTEKWDPDSHINETTSDIGEQQKFGENQKEQNLLNKFIAKCLENCLNTEIKEEKLPQVLFMLEAQNARSQLKWLTNPELPANDLPDELKRHMTKSQINRLLVVRLRVPGNKSEVPVVIVKNSPGSRPSGLFFWKNVCDSSEAGLYLSIRKPLNTEQGTNTLQKKNSRLDNGCLQHGNPKPLEIAIVHHPKIDRDKLACFVHSLRNRWPYFANEVSLPFPFPFATLAKEYAVSAKDVLEESEELEESDLE
jgi:pPIWI_RE module N-terminal domain/RNaseH domain of pPIWI_RE/MID domain of pPIWI_RE